MDINFIIGKSKYWWLQSVSFLGFLGDYSSLLDLYSLDVLAESCLDGLNDVLFVGFEGVEVSSSSDFEFGDFSVSLDEYSWMR